MSFHSPRQWTSWLFRILGLGWYLIIKIMTPSCKIKSIQWNRHAPIKALSGWNKQYYSSDALLLLIRHTLWVVAEQIPSSPSIQWIASWSELSALRDWTKPDIKWTVENERGLKWWNNCAAFQGPTWITHSNSTQDAMSRAKKVFDTKCKKLGLRQMFSGQSWPAKCLAARTTGGASCQEIHLLVEIDQFANNHKQCCAARCCHWMFI